MTSGIKNKQIIITNLQIKDIQKISINNSKRIQIKKYKTEIIIIITKIKIKPENLIKIIKVEEINKDNIVMTVETEVIIAIDQIKNSTKRLIIIIITKIKIKPENLIKVIKAEEINKGNIAMIVETKVTVVNINNSLRVKNKKCKTEIIKITIKILIKIIKVEEISKGNIVMIVETEVIVAIDLKKDTKIKDKIIISLKKDNSGIIISLTAILI